MSDKSIAFVVSYLLGSDSTFLRSNFKLDYENSDECNCFENYYDVNTLRHLNILRQSVLHNFSSYEKRAFPKGVKSSVDFLKSKNIDVEKALMELSLNNYFNYLSDMIETLVFKTFVDIDILDTEILGLAFKFPTLSMKKLEALIDRVNEVSNLTEIYIYGCENIKPILSRTLLSNKNLFYSLMSIENKRYDGKYQTKSIVYRKEMGFDIDESIFIDSDAIIDKYKVKIEKFVPESVETKEVIIETVDIVKTPEIVNIELDLSNLGRVSVDMTDYLKSPKLKLFVDCDNVELFKFLSFIQCLSPANVEGIVLVIDEKSNYLWRVFKNLYKGNIPISTINVPRLKEQKSVVDVVLTKAVCESVYLGDTRNVLLISSDSDFFGLISSLTDVNFGVCYVSTAMGQDYLKYLSNNNVPTLNLLDIENDSTMKKYKDAGFSFLMLYELGKLPMTQWSVSNLSDILYNSFTNETDVTVNIQDIKQFISNNYGKVKVDIRGEKVYAMLEDFEIEID